MKNFFYVLAWFIGVPSLFMFIIAHVSVIFMKKDLITGKWPKELDNRIIGAWFFFCIFAICASAIIASHMS